jgi:hypothetical protein
MSNKVIVKKSCDVKVKLAHGELECKGTIIEELSDGQRTALKVRLEDGTVILCSQSEVSNIQPIRKYRRQK